MRFLRSKFFRLVLAFVSIFIVVTTLWSLWDVLGKQEIVHDRKAELEAVQKENEELKKRLTQVKSESFIEREARNKLGLVQPGEVVVVVPQQGTRDKGQGAGDTRSNWQQWWDLFF